MKYSDSQSYSILRGMITLCIMHLPSDANAKPCLMELSMLLFLFHYPKRFIQSSLTCFLDYTTTKTLTSSLTTMDQESPNRGPSNSKF